MSEEPKPERLDIVLHENYVVTLSQGNSTLNVSIWQIQQLFDQIKREYPNIKWD